MTLQEKIDAAFQWRNSPKSEVSGAYFGYKQVSQEDLNSICGIVNVVFESSNSGKRIYNSMGEILPAFEGQQKLF